MRTKGILRFADQQKYLTMLYGEDVPFLVCLRVLQSTYVSDAIDLQFRVVGAL